MAITGEFIKFAGVLGFAAGSTASLFLLSRAWNFFYRFKELEQEFEELWKDCVNTSPAEEKLANLSYVHKAVRRQVEETESVDKTLLERAISDAEENKAVLKGRTHQLYYIASEKLKDLKREAEQAGKL